MPDLIATLRSGAVQLLDGRLAEPASLVVGRATRIAAAMEDLKKKHS